MKKTALDIQVEELKALVDDLTKVEQAVEDNKDLLDEKIKALQELLKQAEEPAFENE